LYEDIEIINPFEKPEQWTIREWISY
jgi:hypothetical protein